MIDIHIRRQQGDFLVNATFKGKSSGVTALFGPSGSGKTSIVNMVAGLVSPDSGHIRINDHCLFDAEKKINLAPEKRRIGYVFQDGRLFPHLSVKSNLVYGMNLVPRSQRFVAFDAVVELLGISHLLDRRPSKLSGGEKQRVAIGRGLLTSPAMLLMDEPLASLDQDRKQEVMPFIIRMCREFSLPILYVSHSRDEITQLASKVILLKLGRTVAAGSVEKVLPPDTPALQMCVPAKQLCVNA